MEQIGVFIVDDQKLFRQSLALLIDSINELHLLGDYEGGEAFLAALNNIIQPATTYIALLDMDMPGMNGIKLNEILHGRFPMVKVIILSVHISPSLVAQMIHAKASAYLEKNCDKQELVLAIQSVYKTGFYFNRNVLEAIQSNAIAKTARQAAIDNMPVKLSGRERQIIELICNELSNAEIGEQLHISPRTVEGHRVNILNKTGCRNSAGLVLFAIKYGIFTIKKVF